MVATDFSQSLPISIAMFRSLCLPLYVCLVCLNPGLASAQMMAFERDDFIAVSNLSDAKGTPQKLGMGGNACISPDGTKVAFTQSDAAGDRRIAVYDVASGKAALVAGIPGKNEFMPIWAPDGRRIFFNHFGESDWVFAGVDAEGGNFLTLDKESGRKVCGAGPIPKGDEWLCHDLDSFYVLKVSGEGAGTIVRDLPKSDMEISLSMPSWVAVAPDGTTALFVASAVDEPATSDGYIPNAIFQIDLASGKVTRVTPKGVDADHPCWLPTGTEFLFGAFDTKTEQPVIFRMAMAAGSQPVLVVANASSPTLAMNDATVKVQAAEATYVRCILSTGSAQLVFKDEKGVEFQVGFMTKAQRTGMAPDEPYVKFPEEMIDLQAKDQSDTNTKMVGKKFLLRKDATGEVTEIKALK